MHVTHFCIQNISIYYRSIRFRHTFNHTVRTHSRKKNTSSVFFFYWRIEASNSLLISSPLIFTVKRSNYNMLRFIVWFVNKEWINSNCSVFCLFRGRICESACEENEVLLCQAAKPINNALSPWGWKHRVAVPGKSCPTLMLLSLVINGLIMCVLISDYGDWSA